MNNISRELLHFASKSKQLMYVNKMMHRLQRATYKYPANKSLKKALSITSKEFFKTLKQKIQNETLSKSNVDWLCRVNRTQVTPYLYG